jgi:hypothetical protein
MSTPPTMLEARAVVAASELTGLCCPEITTILDMWVDIFINCLAMYHKGQYQFTVMTTEYMIVLLPILSPFSLVM